MTRKNQFELVTDSLNNQEELDLDSHSYFQWQGLAKLQPVLTTRKNQFELVTAIFNDNEKPVWAGHSRFQWQGKTSLSQFLEELVCLCHAQQPVSTTSYNQFEQVTASFSDKNKLVWTSYSQYQQAVRTRKNQFELVTATFNDNEKPVRASHSYFQWQGQTGFSQFQQPGRTRFELVTTSVNHKEKWFELVTASFNKQEEPVWASHS